MKKPVYIGLSMLEISKTLMYEFWYDYIKPKYQCNVKPCYIDRDSIIIHIKTEDVYEDIANDTEKRFDTPSYEINRPSQLGKNKKMIGLMKDESGRKVMKQFVGLKPKAYSYLIDDGSSYKNAKGTKKEMCNKKKN